MKDFAPENLTGPERTQTDPTANPDGRNLLLQDAWSANSNTDKQAQKNELPVAFASQWNFSIDFDPKAYLKSFDAPVDPLKDALKVEKPVGHITVLRDENSQASREFKAKVEGYVNALPDDIKRTINEQKLKVEVMPFVPLGGGALGRYSSWHHKVSIAQDAVNKHPEDAQAQVYQVIGLALDGSNQNESRNRDFQNAVIEDIKNAPPQSKEYLQNLFNRSKSSAYSQLFSEAFAYRQIERTGQALPAEVAKELASTLEYMRKRYK